MKFFHRIPLVLLPGTGCNQLLWRQVLGLDRRPAHGQIMRPSVKRLLVGQVLIQRVALL